MGSKPPRKQKYSSMCPYCLMQKWSAGLPFGTGFSPNVSISGKVYWSHTTTRILLQWLLQHEWRTKEKRLDYQPQEGIPPDERAQTVVWRQDQAWTLQAGFNSLQIAWSREAASIPVYEQQACAHSWLEKKCLPACGHGEKGKHRMLYTANISILTLCQC